MRTTGSSASLGLIEEIPGWSPMDQSEITPTTTTRIVSALRYFFPDYQLFETNTLNSTAGRISSSSWVSLSDISFNSTAESLCEVFPSVFTTDKETGWNFCFKRCFYFPSRRARQRAHTVSKWSDTETDGTVLLHAAVATQVTDKAVREKRRSFSSFMRHPTQLRCKGAAHTIHSGLSCWHIERLIKLTWGHWGNWLISSPDSF